MKTFRSTSLAFSALFVRFFGVLSILLVAASHPQQLLGQIAASGGVAPRIVAQIDPAQRVTLARSTPSIARPQYDRGAVDDSAPANHMILVLKRSADQEATLRQLIDQMHDASSPNYHHWLQPQEFSSRFGPSDADIKKVNSWLEQSGFTVNKVSGGKVAIDFSGTAAQVRSAFHTELHTYVRNGLEFHSNNQDPQIPAALAPVVTGLEALNDIKPASNLHVAGTATFNPATRTATPNWNFGTECFSLATFTLSNCTLYLPSPGDLAVQYNLATLQKSGTNGKGSTVGVISASNVDLGIVQNYRTLFGLDPTNVPNVIVDGTDPGQNSAAIEAYLDVEAVASTAPGATTNLYVAADTLTTSGLVSAILRAVDDDAADILNLSYGECEQALGPSGNQFFYLVWEQAAAQGQSVFVSSGDPGSAGCDDFDTEAAATAGLAISGFTSTPFNTSVGGTDFYYSDYAQGHSSPGVQAQLAAAWGTSSPTVNPATTLQAPIQEQPWNDGLGLNINNYALDATIAGGGGGASTCVSGSDVDPASGSYGLCTAGYPKPAWQAGTGVPADGVRDIPDVALFASDGPNFSYWPICAGVYDCRSDLSNPPYSTSVTAVGGTSASSPAMAGIMAMVDQAQKGRQGNANYTLYALAKQFPNSFNDVTVGSNNVPCTQGTPNCSLDTNGDGYYSLQHFAAGVGYDEASGLGSINGGNLIANWSKVSYNASPNVTHTSLAVSKTSFVHGTPVNLTASVTGQAGVPSGSVAFLSSSAASGQLGLGALALQNGTVTATSTSLPGGTYSMIAEYGGDGTFGGSTSSSVPLTVTPENSINSISALALDSNSNPVTITNGTALPYGDTLYVTATIAGASGAGVASGQVTFMDGATSIGTSNVGSSSSALLTIGTLGQGPHNITAKYSGDASFNPSTSSAISLTTTKGPAQMALYFYPFTGFLPTFTDFYYAGSSVVVVLQIDGGPYAVAPGGTATVTFGSLPPQTVALTPSYFGNALGTATVTFTPTTPGTYVLGATYSGDANFAAQTYPYPATIKVLAPTLAPSTTTMATSTTSVGPDGVIAVTATVTGSLPGVIPTGNAIVDVHGTESFTPLDKTGKVTILIAGYNLLPGANTMYVQYGGDTNYSPSQSAPVTITSTQGDFIMTTTTPTPAIASGGTATAPITFVQDPSYPQGGLTGAITLTCTTSSPAVFCALSSPSVNLPANFVPVSATLTLTSNPGKAEAPLQHGIKPWLGGGIVLAAMFGFLLPGRKRRLGATLSMLILLTLGAGISGCSNSPAASSKPLVSYNVVVNANASGVIHTLELKATVH